MFPDGELPHISLALEAMQRGGLEVLDVESLRRHYARTLSIWTENFESRAAQIHALVDEEKFRIWRVYLAGCAYAFENDDVSIFQVLCRKAGAVRSKFPGRGAICTRAVNPWVKFEARIVRAFWMIHPGADGLSPAPTCLSWDLFKRDPTIG